MEEPVANLVPIERQPDPARKRRNLDDVEETQTTSPPEIAETLDTVNAKKKRKKKNKAKEKLSIEELKGYDAEDLVNYITGGKRKD